MPSGITLETQLKKLYGLTEEEIRIVSRGGAEARRTGVEDRLRSMGNMYLLRVSAPPREPVLIPGFVEIFNHNGNRIV